LNDATWLKDFGHFSLGEIAILKLIQLQFEHQKKRLSKRALQGGDAVMRREAGAIVLLRENEGIERAERVKGGEGSTSMLFERDERPVMKLRV
jgi:hypothetical protein